MLVHMVCLQKEPPSGQHGGVQSPVSGEEHTPGHLWEPDHSFAQNDLGVLMGIRLNMGQKHGLSAKMVNGILGCITESPREVVLPIYFVQVRSHLSAGLPSTRETYWTESNEAPKKQ